MKNSVGWQIVMNARVGSKLQVTATPGFCSLYNWCFQTMWWFSGAPDNPEGETVMERHGAEPLHSAVKCLMHFIRKEVQDPQQDVAHRMIQIATTWKRWRWSELKLAKGNPLVRILNENAHLVDLKWTEQEQAKLKTLVERYTSQGASGAWRVHRWQLAWFSWVLRDTEDQNDISSQSYDEWPLDSSVDSQLFWQLRDSLLPMLVNAPTEYPEPDKDEASNVVLLHEPERYESASPRSPPPQKWMIFCPLPGQVRHLGWWLTMFNADHLDVVYMYGEMGSDERTEMQLKFQDSPNPSVFVTKLKVAGTGRNLTAANHAV